MSKHLTTVVCTRRLHDWFKRRYWVRCYNCDLNVGPYLSVMNANIRAKCEWDMECKGVFSKVFHDSGS